MADTCCYCEIAGARVPLLPVGPDGASCCYGCAIETPERFAAADERMAALADAEHTLDTAGEET